jgi:RecB family endonuclease NucS
MSEELMFTIDPNDKRLATSLPATELAKMQYTERDLQEWVLAHPEILGESAIVIASEVGT